MSESPSARLSLFHHDRFWSLLVGLEVFEDVLEGVGDVEVANGHLLTVKFVRDGARESDCFVFQLEFPFVLFCFLRRESPSA